MTIKPASPSAEAARTVLPAAEAPDADEVTRLRTEVSAARHSERADAGATAGAG
jgi:hypothetical protein